MDLMIQLLVRNQKIEVLLWFSKDEASDDNHCKFIHHSEKHIQLKYQTIHDNFVVFLAVLPELEASINST